MSSYLIFAKLILFHLISKLTNSHYYSKCTKHSIKYITCSKVTIKLNMNNTISALQSKNNNDTLLLLTAVHTYVYHV